MPLLKAAKINDVFKKKNDVISQETPLAKKNAVSNILMIARHESPDAFG